MDSDGLWWILVDSDGCRLILMDSDGFKWILMEFDGFDGFKSSLSDTAAGASCSVAISA